jgi:hypothetical protein
MKSRAATRHSIGAIALLVPLGWAGHVHAQLAAGTTWLRTDAQGQGIVLSVEACCNGGLRLTWQLPGTGGQPASRLTVDSPMNGTEAPVLMGGKPSGETMAIKHVDDHHYTAVVKMNGKPFGTSNGTVSADSKTMTVDSAFGTGSQTQKITETWVRK